jgi:thymidylate synthase (FAD)
VSVVFRTDMTVELVRSMASDRAVLEAARVSTKGNRASDQRCELTAADVGLIQRMVRDRHGSPFEHCVFTFRVEAPIFMWRQHMRHRWASFSEESGRYRVLDGVYYSPKYRPALQVGKPMDYVLMAGPDQQLAIEDVHHKAIEAADAAYRALLEADVAREVARMVLPLSVYSTAYVTMNARALMNFLSLRISSESTHPQLEIEMVARQYEHHFAKLMPVTHEAFVKNERVAP